MKRFVLLTCVFAMLFACASCSKPDYKKVADDFIKASSGLRDYTIKEVADTSSPAWKAVIIYVKQGRASMPLVLFVSNDGRSVVPNGMVFADNKPIFSRKLEPELGRIDFKLEGRDRFVYNPSGKTSVYIFTDPDCPFCKKAKEALQNYSGEYRVIVKYFPLEKIHPGATRKAVNEEAEWLKKSRKDLSASEALKQAQKMVEEDIAEANRAEITGVPTYVMEDGTLKQGLF